MSEHYYTAKPTVEHNVRVIETELRGHKLKFTTDAGVFSKASIDYGSQLLIECLQLPVEARVLDMGCGYGPIGLSAALICTEGVVTMADVNERAVQLTVDNARLNRISNVLVVQSNLFSGLPATSFTHILTNPPIRAGKQVVHQLFDEAYDHLEEMGELWIVIQKKQGASSAFSKLEQRFNKVVEIEKSKGYRVIKAIR